MPNFMMMTSIVSEESLARDTHTHRLGGSSTLNFLKLLMTLKTTTENEKLAAALVKLLLTTP